MARDRKSLDQILRSITPNVYYQPPASVQMKYPAIRYRRNDIDIRYADNTSYSQEVGYEIIAIDQNPDSPMVVALSKLPQIRFVRNYQADGLNHDVFAIYW